jgi:hypothetical protein
MYVLAWRSVNAGTNRILELPKVTCVRNRQRLEILQGYMKTMVQTKGYAAASANAPLAPFAFERRELGPRDVGIAVKYCGICHSDIHQVRDE